MQPLYSLRKEEFSLRPGTKKTLSLLAVFLTVWLSLRYLFPLFSPFVLGAGLALAAEPMVSFLTRRVHVPRPVSAGIGVSMAFSFLAMLILLLCAFLVRELKVLAGVIPDLQETAQSSISLVQNWLLELSSHTPQSLRPLIQNNMNTLFSDGTALLERITGYLLSLAGNLLSHIPDSALGLGTGVISAFLISAKLPKIRAWLLHRIPKEKLRPILAALRRMKTALLGWLHAQVKLMGVTFTILVLGFVLLRIRYAPLWALGVCLVDAFPIVGTGTILLPWSLLHLLQGDSARAIGLLGIYIVVTLTRSALEPKLIGRHLGLDPLVTLIVLYAGYKLWGIGGMILAPLLAVTAIQIVPERRK